jgi:hypothetical protein
VQAATTRAAATTHGTTLNRVFIPSMGGKMTHRHAIDKRSS